MKNLINLPILQIRNLIIAYEKQYSVMKYSDVVEIISNLLCVILYDEKPDIYYKKTNLILDVNMHPKLNELCIDILINLKNILNIFNLKDNYFIENLSRDYKCLTLKILKG